MLLLFACVLFLPNPDYRPFTQATRTVTMNHVVRYYTKHYSLAALFSALMATPALHATATAALSRAFPAWAATWPAAGPAPAALRAALLVLCSQSAVYIALVRAGVPILTAAAAAAAAAATGAVQGGSGDVYSAIIVRGKAPKTEAKPEPKEGSASESEPEPELEPAPAPKPSSVLSMLAVKPSVLTEAMRNLSVAGKSNSRNNRQQQQPQQQQPQQGPVVSLALNAGFDVLPVPQLSSMDAIARVPITARDRSLEPVKDAAALRGMLADIGIDSASSARKQALRTSSVLDDDDAGDGDAANNVFNRAVPSASAATPRVTFGDAEDRALCLVKTEELATMAAKNVDTYWSSRIYSPDVAMKMTSQLCFALYGISRAPLSAPGPGNGSRPVSVTLRSDVMGSAAQLAAATARLPAQAVMALSLVTEMFTQIVAGGGCVSKHSGCRSTPAAWTDPQKKGPQSRTGSGPKLATGSAVDTLIQALQALNARAADYAAVRGQMPPQDRFRFLASQCDNLLAGAFPTAPAINPSAGSGNNSNNKQHQQQQSAGKNGRYLAQHPYHNQHMRQKQSQQADAEAADAAARAVPLRLAQVPEWERADLSDHARAIARLMRLDAVHFLCAAAGHASWDTFITEPLALPPPATWRLRAVGAAAAAESADNGAPPSASALQAVHVPLQQLPYMSAQNDTLLMHPVALQRERLTPADDARAAVACAEDHRGGLCRALAAAAMGAPAVPATAAETRDAAAVWGDSAAAQQWAPMAAPLYPHVVDDVLMRAVWHSTITSDNQPVNYVCPRMPALYFDCALDTITICKVAAVAKRGAANSAAAVAPLQVAPLTSAASESNVNLESRLCKSPGITLYHSYNNGIYWPYNVLWHSVEPRYRFTAAAATAAAAAGAAPRVFPGTTVPLPRSPALPWAPVSASTGALSLPHNALALFARAASSPELGPKLSHSDITTTAPPRACGYFTHDAVTITSTRQAARRVLPLPPALRAALVGLETAEAVLAGKEQGMLNTASAAALKAAGVDTAAAASETATATASGSVVGSPLTSRLSTSALNSGVVFRSVGGDAAEGGRGAAELTHFDAATLALMLDLQAKYSLPVNLNSIATAAAAQGTAQSQAQALQCVTAALVATAPARAALSKSHQSVVRLQRRTGMSLALLLGEGAFAKDENVDDDDAAAAAASAGAPKNVAYPWLPRWARLTPAAPLSGCAAVPHQSLAREPFWLPHLSALRRLYRGALERATFAVDEVHLVTALMANAYAERPDANSPTGVSVACAVPARARLAALFDAMLLSTVLSVRVSQAAAGTLRLRYRSRSAAAAAADSDAGAERCCCCPELAFCPAALVTHTLAEGPTAGPTALPAPLGCCAALPALGSGPAPWVTDALFSLLAPRSSGAMGESAPARLAAISAAAARVLKAEHEYPQWMPGMASVPATGAAGNKKSKRNANDEASAAAQDVDSVIADVATVADEASLARAPASVWADTLTVLDFAQRMVLRWSDSLRALLVMPPLAAALDCATRTADCDAHAAAAVTAAEAAAADLAATEDPWTEGLGLQLSTAVGDGAGDVGSIHVATGLFGGEVPTGDAVDAETLPKPESAFAQLDAMHKRVSAALGSTFCGDRAQDGETVMSLTDLLVDVWHTFGELRLLWQSGLVYPRDGDDTLHGFPLPPEMEKDNSSDCKFEFVASNAVFTSKESPLVTEVPIVFSTCSNRSVQVAKHARAQAQGGFLPAFELKILPSVGEKHGPDGANAEKASFAGNTKCSSGACDCGAPVAVWRNTVELQRFLQAATEKSEQGPVAAAWRWSSYVYLQQNMQSAAQFSNVLFNSK